jgi:hypothetical protein
MPEIAATNNAWHQGDRAISDSHSGGCFYAYTQFILPLWFLSLKKIAALASPTVGRSACESMFVAANILYLRYKPA